MSCNFLFFSYHFLYFIVQVLLLYILKSLPTFLFTRLSFQQSNVIPFYFFIGENLHLITIPLLWPFLWPFLGVFWREGGGRRDCNTVDTGGLLIFYGGKFVCPIPFY